MVFGCQILQSSVSFLIYIIIVALSLLKNQLLLVQNQQEILVDI